MATEQVERVPGYEEYLARVAAMEELVAEEAEEAERLRHMTDRTYAAFRAAHLPHILTPRVLGGAQLPWSEALRVAERMSSIDGSAGWCLMVAGVQNGSAGAFVTDRARDEIFQGTGYTNVAGQGIPRGQAWPVEGGYRIRGHWSYGSGIHHANWIHSGCILMDGDKPVKSESGAPLVLIVYLRREDIELADNWEVMGLRGTGSFDYSVEDDHFVPEHMTHLHSKSEPERGGHQYSVGIVGFTAWGHTSFALGVGRRALDELAAIALKKGGPFGLLADAPSFQEKYARAEAKYRAVRALAYESWEAIDETLAREEPVSTQQLAVARLTNRYAHEVMSEICTFAYNGGGGIALRPSRLQRCYRDLHAGLQHVFLCDELMQDCGKVLVGRAPADATWDVLHLK